MKKSTTALIIGMGLVLLGSFGVANAVLPPFYMGPKDRLIQGVFGLCLYAWVGLGWHLGVFKEEAKKS